MVRDIVDVIRGIFVVGVLIWVGWVIAGAFGWQETIVEILKVMGILIGGGISAWIVYEIYDWRQTQKKAREMREKGRVQHEGEWVTPEEKEAREKIPEFDRIWRATEDTRVLDMKDGALRAINEEDFQKVRKLLEKAHEVESEKINRVVKVIDEEFESGKKYKREDLYQTDLRGFLRSKFPSTKIEEAKGSTRPDIAIGEIAIEIKGPTYASDLETIADKAMRYTQHYDHLIVVLFDINASNSRFEEWKEGMKGTYPTVRIIEK